MCGIFSVPAIAGVEKDANRLLGGNHGPSLALRLESSPCRDGWGRAQDKNQKAATFAKGD